MTGGVLHGPQATFGTAIAAIRVPAEAVIAADSRVVDASGRRMPDECKIRILGDTAYTAHGMSTDAATGFNLFDLVSTAARSPGTFKSSRPASRKLWVARYPTLLRLCVVPIPRRSSEQ